MPISDLLIAWYLSNARSLPWRETSDPYSIWLSEIILQQTRVNQGLPYYQRFMNEFPDVTALAEAPADKVLKLWQGLGYYSRARNMHRAAKMLVEQFNGSFPSNYDKIRSLPGIGDYTAAAIASFAFGLPFAVVDGNVIRVLSRLFGVGLPPDSTEGKKEFARIARNCLDSDRPALYNQAIMEFGALYCTASNPGCDDCIFRLKCLAYNKGEVGRFPVKKKKANIRSRYMNYLLIHYRQKTYLNQRLANDIWQNLYDLPVIETTTPRTAVQITKSKTWKDMFEGILPGIVSVTEGPVHKLSHQHIYLRFFEIKLEKKPGPKFQNNFIEVETQNVVNYPVPKPIEKIFQEKLEKYSLS